ncbi:MAG: type II toxin-antitoxin system VapC family toxin [Acidimicrobiia bacterium]|nr:type II toxin-antitoxin system VapC family toxin [Acidimicrobiia bacterium]
MIYLDSSALIKFVRVEAETVALRSWRAALAPRTALVTSELAELEIARTLRRAGVDHEQVPYVTGQVLRGVHLVDLTRTVLARAMIYRSRLGPLDAIHLATADPFRDELTDFVTYDGEQCSAAADIGLPTAAPR